MKPTSLETLMNCNVLPMKKHLNFYSFGGEFEMRKVRTDAIENTTLNSVQKFVKLVSVSKQIECCSRQIAV